LSPTQLAIKQALTSFVAEHIIPFAAKCDKTEDFIRVFWSQRNRRIFWGTAIARILLRLAI
jgi:hypothetical protein